MQVGGLMVAFALAGLSMPSVAQAPKVLGGNEITEAALIEALDKHNEREPQRRALLLN